jgi:hypothetical protein
LSYITPAQLAFQRRITLGTFKDTCQRLVYTDSAAGDYGYNAESYPAGAQSPCLFEERPILEAQGQTQVQMADARLYLPLTFTLDARDRVQIIAMSGEAVAVPKTYAITKGPLIKDVMLYAELSLVTQ